MNQTAATRKIRVAAMADSCWKGDKIPVRKGEPLKNQLEEFLDNVRHDTDPRVAGTHGFEALQLASRICEQMTPVGK